ncbi:MAG TPA: TonB-dependent receptor, partial [Thermoanaerobaculia bacterium]|nr:TonB-dependent receptor [Thermoanaerobaculia bacterium]
GAPLFGERRAGVETSFVDPLLVGEVQVVRGPSSTFQGAGALGGVVEVFPRRRAGWSAEAGWASQGSERSAAVGWGGGGWSLAAAWRDAGDAETADGERLFSRSSRLTASAERSWTAAAADWSLVVWPSAVRDVGKPNVDVSRRTTLYPAEDHLVASLTALFRGGWHGNAWLHPHAVDTRTTEADGARALVENDAFDGGVRVEREARLSAALALRAGGEAVARRAVDAVETAFDPAGRRLAAARPLDGAAQDELSAFASLAWALRGATLAAGGRWTHLGQDNRAAGAAGLDDAAWNGFAGAVVPLGGGLRATGNLGTGMRWPTLSERFFTGTTGRGAVVANPGLGPERSLQGDLGLAWSGRRAHLAAHVFQSEIEGFIEQVELPAREPGESTSTFVNLGEGTLRGVEVEGVAELAPGWTLSAGGHAIDGENEAGGALSDVPADRLSANLAAGPAARLAGGRLTVRLRVERRAAIDDPGPGERAIPGATLVSAGLGWQLGPGFVLTLSGGNLTDRRWLPAADDKAMPAAGRSVGVSLRWER